MRAVRPGSCGPGMHPRAFGAASAIRTASGRDGWPAMAAPAIAIENSVETMPKAFVFVIFVCPCCVIGEAARRLSLRRRLRLSVQIVWFLAVGRPSAGAGFRGRPGYAGRRSEMGEAVPRARPSFQASRRQAIGRIDASRRAAWRPSGRRRDRARAPDSRRSTPLLPASPTRTSAMRRRERGRRGCPPSDAA